MGILIMLITASCVMPKNAQKNQSENENLVPLTESLIKEYKITSAMLKKLQFWTGEDSISLEKQTVSKGATVGPAGKLLVKNSEVTDRIMIPAYTPGVCLAIDSSGRMNISFSPDNSSFLVFGLSSEGNYVIFTLKGGSDVNYGKGGRYTIASGIGTKLLVSPEEIKDYNSQRIEQGRLVQ